MPIYSASRGAAAGAAIMAAVIALALCSPRPAAAFRGQREPNEVGAPLETSVTALKASYTAITARLPKNLQHSVPRAFAIVSQLPMVRPGSHAAGAWSLSSSFVLMEQSAQ